MLCDNYLNPSKGSGFNDLITSLSLKNVIYTHFNHKKVKQVEFKYSSIFIFFYFTWKNCNPQILVTKRD